MGEAQLRIVRHIGTVVQNGENQIAISSRRESASPPIQSVPSRGRSDLASVDERGLSANDEPGADGSKMGPGRCSAAGRNQQFRAVVAQRE